MFEQGWKLYGKKSIFTQDLWKPHEKLCQLQHESHMLPGPDYGGAGQDSARVSSLATVCWVSLQQKGFKK